MGGDKYFADLLGYLFDFFDAASPGNFIHQFTAVKAPVVGHLFKIRIDFQQFVVVHYVADKAEGKQGLDTAGAAGNDAQGAGGGDGRTGGVAQFNALILKDALFPIGEYPPLLGQVLGGFVGVFLYKPHHGFSGFQSFIRVIWDF